MIVLKSKGEIEKLRVANGMVARILCQLKEMIRPGVTTLELDRFAENECRKLGAKPAFKGYGGFPFTICSSPNDRVVHGFPNGDPLVDGDILSIDFGLIYDGFYGDSAFTFPVGTISVETERLLKVTEESLYKAIYAAVPGGRLSDISHAVQSHVEKFGYGVVREFVGHGIGRKLHESPQIPNYGNPGTGVKLKSGMTLAIEPMINAGGCNVRILSDKWTAVTSDGSMSAHFEHSIVITDNGPEILSVP